LVPSDVRRIDRRRDMSRTEEKIGEARKLRSGCFKPVDDPVVRGTHP
jgi:hypothetical protein